MHPHPFMLFAFAALTITGCGSGPIGKPTVDLEAAEARAAQIDTQPMTRERVHALLGEPWLASGRFNVEVYRLQGKQHNLAVIMAVPMPFPSDALEAYTLVTYGPDGLVNARASDFVYAAPSEVPTVVLRAGDFQFVHFLRDTLSVSLPRYLQARSEQGTASTCLVLVGADPARLAAADGGMCFGAANLYVDDGKRQGLWLTSTAVIPPSRTSEPACRNAGGRYVVFTTGGPGACVFDPQTLYPVTLPVGSHVLRFSSSPFDKGVVGTPSCKANEVTFATLTGKFLACTVIEGGRRRLDQPDDGSLQLSAQPAATGRESQVVINDNGIWLVQ